MLVTLRQPEQMAGVIMTALIIGQVLQPFTGRLADRVGGRGFTLLGLTMTSVGGGLIGLTHQTWELIILVVLIGIGGAFFHPQALAGVRSLTAGRHGFVTAVFLVGGEVGRGLWPTIASIIVTVWGLPALWVIALPGLAMLPLLWRAAPALPPAPRGVQALRMREHGAPLAMLIGYQSVRTLSIYSFSTFIPILWDRRGAPLITGASLITVMLLAGIAGNLTGGALADRIGFRPLLITASVSSSVLLVPTVYLTGPAEWAAAALLGAVFFLTSAVTVGIGQSIFPENPSMGSGLALGFGNSVGAAAVLLVGLAIGGDGLHIVFWILASLSLAGVIPAWLLGRRLPR